MRSARGGSNASLRRSSPFGAEAGWPLQVEALERRRQPLRQRELAGGLGRVTAGVEHPRQQGVGGGVGRAQPHRFAEPVAGRRRVAFQPVGVAEVEEVVRVERIEGAGLAEIPRRAGRTRERRGGPESRDAHVVQDQRRGRAGVQGRERLPGRGVVAQLQVRHRGQQHRFDVQGRGLADRREGLDRPAVLLRRRVGLGERDAGLCIVGPDLDGLGEQRHLGLWRLGQQPSHVRLERRHRDGPCGARTGCRQDVVHALVVVPQPRRQPREEVRRSAEGAADGALRVDPA